MASYFLTLKVKNVRIALEFHTRNKEVSAILCTAKYSIKFKAKSIK